MNCIAQAIGLGPALLFPPNPNSNSNPNNSHSQYRKKCTSLLQKCRNSNEITPIHANIIKNGEDDDVFIVFELLRVCSKCNAIDYALNIFKQFSKPNVYLYTALVDGLVLSGLYDHGIRVYMQMIENFVMPDNYVISSVLKACGFYGDLRTGRGIHAQSAKLGLCSNRSVKLKLLEVYGKCGEFENMKRVFDEMPDRDIVALTVMISSYLDCGFVKNASDVFDLVRIKDTVCWTAMIDGLVRNEEMNKALEIFRQMQREGVRGNEITVVCVLSACAQLGALELGRWIHSYIEKYEVNNEIHEFFLGDIRHLQKEAIYRKLEELNETLRSEGYNPQIEVVSQDITDREKEWALAIHSERLAICYGLISTEPQRTLRIIKNLRVCNDCHSVIKLISKITGRRIVVRDRNRFHHLQNGVCSCGDYW